MTDFEWPQFLYVAFLLAGRTAPTPTEEALARAAISRAYYAAFVTARNFLRDREGVSFAGQDAHRLVANYFAASTTAKRRKIGSLLRRMRELRNQADYKDRIADLSPKTRRTLDNAQWVIAAVNRL